MSDRNLFAGCNFKMARIVYNIIMLTFAKTTINLICLHVQNIWIDYQPFSTSIIEWHDLLMINQDNYLTFFSDKKTSLLNIFNSEWHYFCEYISITSYNYFWITRISRERNVKNKPSKWWYVVRIWISDKKKENKSSLVFLFIWYAMSDRWQN